MYEVSARKPHGNIVIVGESATIEADTLSCAHCSGHWKVERGSGRKRGWCMKCMGPTCGQDPCESHCMPTEKMLEEIEKAATYLIRIGQFA